MCITTICCLLEFSLSFWDLHCNMQYSMQNELVHQKRKIYEKFHLVEVYEYDSDYVLSIELVYSLMKCIEFNEITI